MKKLLLMRHAKSSWGNSDIPDHERPLKKRGFKDAERMGKLLKSKELEPDLIMSSTALRAKQTAETVAETCKCKKEIMFLDSLYMAEPSDILRAIEKHSKDKKVVMVIGHNPGLEAFLQIANGKVESLPTASIAYLTAAIDDWSKLEKGENIKLKKLWRPKDLD
ncbi:MAG: histidine phosphatase family protein [Anaerolineaceae bacterium]|jgi:phosphohistidine phosphatase|nr:histidine phosphatase family protein [Anaerolineaceae bacterium]